MNSFANHAFVIKSPHGIDRPRPPATQSISLTSIHSEQTRAHSVRCKARPGSLLQDSMSDEREKGPSSIASMRAHPAGERVFLDFCEKSERSKLARFIPQKSTLLLLVLIVLRIDTICSSSSASKVHHPPNIIDGHGSLNVPTAPMGHNWEPVQSTNYVINKESDNVSQSVTTTRVAPAPGGGGGGGQGSDVSNHASSGRRSQRQFLFPRPPSQQQPLFAAKYASTHNQNQRYNEHKLAGNFHIWKPERTTEERRGIRLVGYGTVVSDGSQSTNQSNHPLSSSDSRLMSVVDANGNSLASQQPRIDLLGSEIAVTPQVSNSELFKSEDEQNTTDRFSVPPPGAYNLAPGPKPEERASLVKEFSPYNESSRAQRSPLEERNNESLSAVLPDLSVMKPESAKIDNRNDVVVTNSSFDEPNYVADGAIDHLDLESDIHLDDHLFRESDDLFLLEDYRSKPSKFRQRRSQEQPSGELSQAEPLILDKSSQVRTIYFGGFFPWLADKRVQNHLDVEQNYGLTSDIHHHIFDADHRMIDSKSQRKSKKRGPLSQKNELADSTFESHPEKQHQVQPASTTATQYTNSETRHQLGKFILPAVRLALDHINTNNTILSAYKLEVVPRDTQVSCISLKSTVCCLVFLL
jgi:hypothetical protein